MRPVECPEKILCIGVNYGNRHAEYKDGREPAKYPSMFFRTPGSFVGSGEPLVKPAVTQQFDYEGEIALVIGREGRRIARSARTSTSPATPCATKAPRASGRGTPSSMSPKARTSTRRAASVPGW